MKSNRSELLSLLPFPGQKNAGGKTLITDVLISLLPALVFALYVYRLPFLFLFATTILFAFLFEWLYDFLLKKESSFPSGTFAVTGVILSLILPVGTPFYMGIPAAFFSIVLMKKLLETKGGNPINPALFGQLLTILLFYRFLFSANEGQNIPDALSSATPLSNLLDPIVTTGFSYTDAVSLLLSQRGSSPAEASPILLLAGWIYLLCRHVVSAHISLSFLLSAAAVAFFLPESGFARFSIIYTCMHLLSGSLLFVSVFMANDYKTSPKTKKGKILYGAFLGFVTMGIRYFFAVEGAWIALFLGNILVYLLSKVIVPKPYNLQTKNERSIPS